MKLFRTSGINFIEVIVMCFTLNHPLWQLDKRTKKFMDKYAI